MKIFNVEIVQHVQIVFESDQATETSAVHVAEKCVMRNVPDVGLSRIVGDWKCELVRGEVKTVTEVQR